MTNSASILEGLATILAGVASYWIVQDFPDTAKFLSEAERTFVVRRLQGDDQYSAAGEKLQMKNILSSFRDWKTWFSSTATFFLTCKSIHMSLTVVQLMERLSRLTIALPNGCFLGMRHASVRILSVHSVDHKPGTIIICICRVNIR
jgi:hypothetical protein